MAFYAFVRFSGCLVIMMRRFWYKHSCLLSKIHAYVSEPKLKYSTMSISTYMPSYKILVAVDQIKWKYILRKIMFLRYKSKYGAEQKRLSNIFVTVRTFHQLYSFIVSVKVGILDEVPWIYRSTYHDNITWQWEERSKGYKNSPN